jgi:hypothetical protein
MTNKAQKTTKPAGRPPGGKKSITDLELRMLNNGYASVRIVAAKTFVHQTTWLYRVRRNEVEHKTVANRAFISIESVRELMGKDSVDILKLDDWSDVDLNGG